MPMRWMVRGLPEASSAIVKEPALPPVVVGLNETLIVQFASAATVAPHVLVCAKLALVEMLLMFRVSVPVFDSVTICGALDNPMS